MEQRQTCRLCGKPAKARRLCSTHYARWLRKGTTDAKPWERRKEECDIDECHRPVLARNLCSGHYGQQMRGKPFTPVRDRAKPGESPGFTKANGYRYIYLGDNRYQLEHRVVMKEKLGRPLERNEHVHHINGVRSDNRPENLEIWLTGHPPGQRIEDQVEWAQGILQRYAPEKLK